MEGFFCINILGIIEATAALNGSKMHRILMVMINEILEVINDCILTEKHEK